MENKVITAKDPEFNIIAQQAIDELGVVLAFTIHELSITKHNKLGGNSPLLEGWHKIKNKYQFGKQMLKALLFYQSITPLGDVIYFPSDHLVPDGNLRFTINGLFITSN